MESQAANVWLCGLADWDEFWADPARYTVALVMTPLGTNSRDSFRRKQDSGRLDKPLMMVQVPLSEAVR